MDKIIKLMSVRVLNIMITFLMRLYLLSESFRPYKEIISENGVNYIKRNKQLV